MSKKEQRSKIIKKLKGTKPSRCLVSPSHLHWLGEKINTLKEGTMVECGVARGGTIAFCHKENPNFNIFGLDSWDAMPEITDKDDQGKCKKWVGSRWGTMQDVYDTYKFIGASTENLTLIKGYFSDSIPKNIHLFEDIDILRLDCDFYEPITYCLEMLYDKVKVGGFVILDDWHFNQSGVQSAVNEFLDKRNLKVNFVILEKGRGPAYFEKP